jgi:UDP-N-acetylmuramoylalanine--D-glutamate ligase
MLFTKKPVDKTYPKSFSLDKKSFAVYGLGATGRSVIKFLNKKKIKNLSYFDDNKVKNPFKKLISKNYFAKKLDESDYIILSPGISIEKSKLKKKLLKNRHKIITDLDIFYLINSKIRTIVVTGSNGKSTTCKIIEHLLNKNNINSKLGGNIGKPILDVMLKKNSLAIIEASSFQLEYSQFIKPSYAIILNITKDHLDWHKTMKNYANAKFKIFLNQKKNNFAFVNNKKFIDKYKKEKFKGKVKFVSMKSYTLVRNKIKNIYLKSKINDENMSFVYEIAKKFNISNSSFIRSVNSFKGLEHRHEIFYQNKKMKFINDSKATSFEATKNALKNNKNIYWILGGLPKKNDIFNLKKLKKKIIKAYIIGKNTTFFEKQIKGKIPYIVSKNLKNVINHISRDIKFFKKTNSTILLSPAAASYDQFRNFEERGTKFKKLIKKNRLIYV